MKHSKRMLVALVAALITGLSGCWEGSDSGSRDRGSEDGDWGDESSDEDWDEESGSNGGESEGDWYQHCHVMPYLCEDIGESMAHQAFGCCFDTIHFWCEYDINGDWALKGLECADESEGGFCDKGPDGIDCF